jgi:hypothetical protein
MQLGALRVASLSFPFNSLEGQAAPHNSFVSISLVDSNPIGSTNFFEDRSSSHNDPGLETALRYLRVSFGFVREE